MTLPFTDEGWLLQIVFENDAAVAKAQAKAGDDEGDQRRGRGELTTEAFRPDETWGWIGYLGETLVEALLVERGIACKRHGGIDSKPDLEIDALGATDVKTRHSAGPFRSHYALPFSATRLAKPAPDFLLFTNYVATVPPVLLVLGVIRAEPYFTEATFVRKGGEIPGGAISALDVFHLPAHRLTPIRNVLDYLERRKHG